MKATYKRNAKEQQRKSSTTSDTLHITPLNPMQKGFALIATVSILALLAVVALATMTMSTVEVRNSNIDRNIQIAQANARMALTIAIGELQRTTGSDMRATASADIAGDTSEHVRQLYGSWITWQGTDHDETGLPIPPEYDEKFITFDGEQGRFGTWLINGSRAELSDPNSPPSLRETTDTVPLLAAGTVADENQQVHVVPSIITDPTVGEDGNQTGSYAWWAYGEGLTQQDSESL